MLQTFRANFVRERLHAGRLFLVANRHDWSMEEHPYFAELMVICEQVASRCAGQASPDGMTGLLSRSPLTTSANLAMILMLVAVTGCTDSQPESVVTPPPFIAPRSSSSLGQLSLGLPRAVHRSTTLQDGRVLFTGGCTTPGCEGVVDAASSVLFDPSSGTVQPGPSLLQPRLSHTATLLDDGRVLVVGGYGGEGHRRLDPSRCSIPGLTRSLQCNLCAFPEPTTLPVCCPMVGCLLLAAAGLTVQRCAVLRFVDPATSTVAEGPDLPQPRTAQTATMFESDVLLVGGITVSDDAVDSTVRYDSQKRRWIPGPSLDRARVKHAAVALPQGGVLVIGGSGSTESRDAFADTEVLWPGSHQFRPGPPLPDGRYKLTDAAAALSDGRVAVAGGTTLDVIDLAADSVEVVSSPSLGTPRAFQTINVVSKRTVLVAGGYDAAIIPTDEAWLIRIG